MFTLAERSFFFASSRRHTRWPRDWSSDVCSSDLFSQAGFSEPVEVPLTVNPAWENWTTMLVVIAMSLLVVVGVARARRTEIGRASCRERVQLVGGAREVVRKGVASGGGDDKGVEI